MWVYLLMQADCIARILQDRVLGIDKYYFFINGTTEKSFEILYTALVLCGHEDELNWNKWRERQAR